MWGKPFRENWAEAFHFIAVAIGIFIAGWWALYTYGALEQKNKAEVELEKANIELSKTKEEIKEIRSRIDGNFSNLITIEPKSYFDNGKNIVIIEVEIKNIGTNDAIFHISSSSINIYKVDYKKDNVRYSDKLSPKYYRSLGKGVEAKNIIFDKQLVTQGAYKKLSFFSELPSDGVYYITFEAKVNEDLSDRLKNNGIDQGTVWFSSKYLYVKNSLQ